MLVITLDALYAFCSQQGKTAHFSAGKNNEQLIVSIPATMAFEQDGSDDKEGLSGVVLRACHIDENINKSFISRDTMTAALPSFANRPILGYIYRDNDGNYQFRDHAKHINEDGEVVYDERPIGNLPESCNAHLEFDEENGKTYVVVRGYIYDEYSKAKEIIEREGECAVSIELGIREFSYDAKRKLLIFSDVYCEGITVLGYWEDGTPVMPGMEGSNIKLADFQKTQNEAISANVVMELLQNIDTKLTELTINNSARKEESAMEEQNKNTQPAVEENATPAPTENEPTPVVEGQTPVEPEASAEPTTPSEPEAPTEPEAAVEPETPAEPEATSTEAVFTKTFELSHEDIRCALYGLLEAVEEATQHYCYIREVYDNTFIYENNEKLYRQNYSKTDDTVSFEGEPVHMNAEYVTDEELAILNEMRNNYPSLVEKLAQYESEPEKLALLNSADFALIHEVDAYKELCKRENYFSLSKEDIEARCKDMLIEEAKKLGGQYSAKETPKSKVTTKPVVTTGYKATGSGRYGAMFVK